jgi:hypothetical protein
MIDETEKLKAMLFDRDETIRKLVEELSFVTKTARLSALEKELAMIEPMPCGHQRRYGKERKDMLTGQTSVTCLECAIEECGRLFGKYGDWLDEYVKKEFYR